MKFNEIKASTNDQYTSINRLFFKHFEKNLVELKEECVKDEEPLKEDKP